jgi:hypothetical protein
VVTFFLRHIYEKLIIGFGSVQEISTYLNREEPKKDVKSWIQAKESAQRISPKHSKAFRNGRLLLE